MIKFQQRQALTSHFESFWSIVHSGAFESGIIQKSRDIIGTIFNSNTTYLSKINKDKSKYSNPWSQTVAIASLPFSDLAFTELMFNKSRWSHVQNLQSSEFFEIFR